MGVKKVYDDGAIFAAEVLDISNAYIIERFQFAV